MRYHINFGTNRRFYALTRRAGARKWERAGPDREKEETAIADLARAMKNRIWKRGMVCFISDYYDPVSVLKMDR